MNDAPITTVSRLGTRLTVKPLTLDDHSVRATGAPISPPTHAPTKAPSPAPKTANPTKPPTKPPTKDPTKQPTMAPTVAILELTGLDLFYAQTDAKIVTLTNTTTIRRSDLRPRMSSPQLNVVADFSGAVLPNTSSVVFGWNHNTRFAIENKAPFALCGNWNSDVFSCNRMSCGTHAVTATLFTGTNGQGVAGKPYSVTFRITNCN